MKAVLALAFVFIAGPTSAGQAGAPPVDLVTVTTTAGDAIYVLDAASGHVSFAPVPATLPATIPIDTMTGLQLPAVIRVTAIAAWRDRLVFIDRGAPRPVLRTLDPASGAINTVRTDAALEQPTALAVSSSGEIAVADQARRAIVWIRDQEPAQVTPWPDIVLGPLHLEFDGRSLLALDGGTHQIVNLTLSGKAGQSAPARAASVVVAPAALAGISAFSVHRGVYYLSNGVTLFALAPRGVPRRVPCAGCAPALVRASPQRLYLYDAERRQLAIMTRPVPIGISLETSFADGQQALSSFYDYLSGRNLLLTRDYVSERGFPRVIDAVRAAGAALPVPNGAADTAVPAAFSALLCRYNTDRCAQSPSFVTAPMASGSTITIPDYAVQPFIRPDTVELRDTTVAELLRGVQALDANAGRLEYVQNLNAASFENTLSRHGLVIASPARGDIPPGTIVTLRGVAEQAGQDLSTVCGVSLPSVEQPAPLDVPDRVNRVLFKDFVPLGANSDGTAKDLGARDGDLYAMSFRRMKIVQLDLNAARASPAAANLAACMKKLATRPAGTPEPLLVVEALRVEGALYDFAVPPRRLSIERPFYLAYRAVPVSAFADRPIGAALATVVPPAVLKPGGPQDLLSRKTGSIDLPAIGWSLNALVPADELDDPRSALHALERVPSGRILFLSREVAASTAASLPDGAPADQDPPQDLDADTVARMKEERRLLLAAIDYHDLDRERRTPVKIAIGEANVYKDHPSMSEEVGGVTLSAFWTQATPTAPFVRHQITPPAIPGLKKRRFNETDDHGVHVAGLLAARESSVLPGLLPHAELFIIDTTTVNPSDLHKSIVQAATQGVKIFNLSLSFENIERETVDDIRADFKNNLGRQLFIVAAGDGGLDLSDHQIPPIGWMHDVRSHMVGVGMSTHDGNGYQREIPDLDKGPGATKGASNVGHEYVQIAAPGEGVFSLGSQNSYTDATGTSQSTPQVTAAAAMLSNYSANQIKARLIYTATWLDAKNYIWGGRLNVHRAAWFPSRNLYISNSDTKGPPIAAEFDPLMQISIGGERQMAEPDGTPAVAPATIPFADVLRLTTVSNGNYRVHFIDRPNGNRLRIIEEAEVHGIAHFTPKSAARWDPARKEFVDFTPSDDGRDISEFMWDYVARVPDVCELQTGVCNPNIVF